MTMLLIKRNVLIDRYIDLKKITNISEMNPLFYWTLPLLMYISTTLMFPCYCYVNVMLLELGITAYTGLCYYPGDSRSVVNI
jgi:hypothetical protein